MRSLCRTCWLFQPSPQSTCMCMAAMISFRRLQVRTTCIFSLNPIHASTVASDQQLSNSPVISSPDSTYVLAD